MDRRHSSGGGDSLQDMCRICRCEGKPDFPLISPCFCSGSLRYVHQSCLHQWISCSDRRCCELCKFHFIMRTEMKPFKKWEKLDMSPGELRRVLCSIPFHMMAITCFVCSLYLMFERSTKQKPSGLLDWLVGEVVVAFGFMGGLIFIIIQCKMYAQLFRRWRTFNSIIYVQNAPEKSNVQQQQQQMAVFSAADELATVLTNEDIQHLSLEEDDFHSCQSSSNSNSNITNNVDSDNIKNTSGKTSEKTDCSQITLTDNVPIAEHNHPLSEVVVH